MLKATPTFGLQLRRANELVSKQGQQAFARLGVRLDARKTSLVFMLHEHGEMSSTDLAGAIGLSRQLVEARLKQLAADHYVVSAPSTEDARKRVYSLAPEARADAERAIAVMQDFEAVFEALWEELGFDANAALAELERTLELRPLLGRLCERFPHHKAALKAPA